MTATGWCEDCGDIEVEPLCMLDRSAWVLPADGCRPKRECCHYADCPMCGSDVDQWAWA